MLDLWGKTARVECRGRELNELDLLYKTPIEKPQMWDDHPRPAELVDDAPWRIVDLVRRQAGG